MNEREARKRILELDEIVPNGKWEILARSDTLNIKVGRRCVGRLQTKLHTVNEAKLLVIARNHAPAMARKLEAIEASCRADSTNRHLAERVLAIINSEGEPDADQR